MKSMNAIAALVSLLVVVLLPGNAAGATTDAHVQGYLEGLAERHAVPGLAVAVGGGGRPTREWVLGEDGDGSAVDAGTPFLIGSVAKSMTATLVLQRVRAGEVRLDDSIDRLLPRLDGPDATVEQLLTHTSGYTAADGLAVSERFDSAPGAMRRAAADLEATGTTGTYEYSSANYLVLGVLVEKLTGRRYADVLRTDLLAPLRMSDTSGSASDVAGLPPGHRHWWGRAVAYDPGFDESGAAYGYVVSTLADLERYAAAHAGAAPAVLPRRLLHTLHAPRTAAEDDRYGYGWRIRRVADGTVVHHTGATPGYFAHVSIHPDGRWVVLLANAYGEANAPALVTASDDVLAILDGGRRTAAAADPVLSGAPWVLAGVFLAGVLAIVLGWRRPRRRALRLLVAAFGLAVFLGLGALPLLLGAGPALLWTWSPDVAVALAAAIGAWILLTGLMTVRARGATVDA